MSRRALPGTLPPVGRMRAVQRWLSSRGGINSWALVDSGDACTASRRGRVYVSASLVKAMLLAAYLPRDRQPGTPTPASGPRSTR